MLASMVIDGGLRQRSQQLPAIIVPLRGSLDSHGTGCPKPMTSQRTVTGAAAFLLGNEGKGPHITHATVGKVIDGGIKDAANLGAAMAPAAVDTIVTHLQDTGRSVKDYDLIVTGDLGYVGHSISLDLASEKGFNISGVFNDCGILIYNPDQDTHSGGSGCACSGVVVAGHLLDTLRKGKYKRILVVGTGALLSSTSIQQGETIPGIGHGLVIEAADPQ